MDCCNVVADSLLPSLPEYYIKNMYRTVFIGNKCFSAIIVIGNNNMLRDNLVTLSVFPGSYQDRYEVHNLEFMASIEIQEATNTSLVGNVVAGSERAAYRLNGESCAGGESMWVNNTAHSTVMGLTMWDTDCLQREMCSLFNGFYVYKSFSYGFYSNCICSIVIQNSKFVDNGMSIFPYIMGPGAQGHAFKRKFLKVFDSLFVGASDSYNCTTDVMRAEDHANIRLSGPAISWAFKHNYGRIALGWPMFASGGNLAPVMALNKPMAPPALYGNTIFEGNH